jgi:hypothetical protein
MSSTKRTVGKAVMAPLIAAGTSVATRYVVKKGPEFVEQTLLPWLREATQGAGGPAEKLQEKARSAVSSGGDLAEQLGDRARDVTGLGDGDASGGGRNGGGLSQDELSRRTDERAKRRAQRRKTTKRK